MKKPTANTPLERYKKALLSWDVIASTLILIALAVMIIGLSVFKSPDSKNAILGLAAGMSGAAAVVVLSRKKENKK